jgi:hypothetical protein
MNSRIPLIAVLLTAACLAGCSTQNPTTVTEKQFITYYQDQDTYTDVWYMGSDTTYDYFCMEHWTFKPDGSDATLDKRSFYRVTLVSNKVKSPFPVTQDEQKWRLMRPNSRA